MKEMPGKEKDIVQKVEPDSQPDVKAVDQSRRAFAKVGIASPVVMSMYSRPVWSVSCSPSGAMSGNASGHNHDECRGNGCTPGFWKRNLDAWGCTPFSPGTCGGPIGNNGKCPQWDSSVVPGGASTWSQLMAYAGITVSYPFLNGDSTSMLDIMLEHEVANSEANSSVGTFFNHIVAAILNVTCSPIAYGQTMDSIAAMVNTSWAEGWWGEALEVLDKMNNAGHCFLNSRGDCSQPRWVIDPYSGWCIPSCGDGDRWDPATQTCVEDTCPEGTYYNYQTGQCEPNPNS